MFMTAITHDTILLPHALPNSSHMHKAWAVAQLLQGGYTEEVWWEGVASAGLGVGMETGPDQAGVEQVLVDAQLKL